MVDDDVKEQVKDAARPKINNELLVAQNKTNDLLKILITKKDVQIDNQIQFKDDWIKAKTRSGYFSGITFLLMTVAIVLDVVKVEDASVIIGSLLSLFG